MGLDVDGLYTKDPKIHSSARLIKHISLPELENIQHKIEEVKVPDVTGGMRGKMLELIPVVAHGIKVTIVNATKTNIVYRALMSEKVIGTTIEGSEIIA